MSNERDMIGAWQTAAADLGIEVHSPCIVEDETFPVHVVFFGRPAGALPVLMGDQRSRRRAEEKGFFISLLNPAIYCNYDRAQFIETLVDWGWFGSTTSEAPTWYKYEVARVQGLTNG